MLETLLRQVCGDWGRRLRIAHTVLQKPRKGVMLACTGGVAGDGLLFKQWGHQAGCWCWKRGDWRVEILVCALTEETKGTWFEFIPSTLYLLTSHCHPVESFILPSLRMNRVLFYVSHPPHALRMPSLTPPWRLNLTDYFLSSPCF